MTLQFNLMKIIEEVSKKLPFSCFVFFKVLTAEFEDCKIKEITDKKKCIEWKNTSTMLTIMSQRSLGLGSSHQLYRMLQQKLERFR